MSEWTCHTCHRVIHGPQHVNTPEHDQTIHAAYQRKNNRIMAIGLGIVAVGIVLQVAGLILRMAGG